MALLSRPLPMVVALLTCLILSGAVHVAFGADDDDEEEKKSEKIEAKPPYDNFAYPAAIDDLGREASEQALAVAREFLGNGDGDVRKIIKTVKAAQKKAKGYLGLDYVLGELYLWDEHHKNATKYFKKCLTANPNFYEAETQLGRLAVKDLELEDAMELYDSALSKFEWYEDAIFSKYDLYLMQGHLKLAVKELERLKKVSDIEWLDQATEMVERAIVGPSWPKEYRAETDNYIVRTGIDQSMADLVVANAEKVRTLYGKYFMDVPRIGRKYEIIVYRSRGEYNANGGPRSAGGHYSPYLRSMHIFPYDKLSDMMLVLYHEGFHQYLHEYLDNIPQWFNEGLGDFFGGAMINAKGTKAKMGPSPWRTSNVRMAYDRDMLPPVSRLMNMTRAEMYDPQMGALYYAQAWAIVYYCLESGKGKYKGVLKKYFTALRKGMSQREAYRRTFAKIDLGKFEDGLRGFVKTLPSSDAVTRERESIIGK